MTDREVLRPLVDRVLELSALPCQRERAELSARLNALQTTPRAPVIVTHEGIPFEHWRLMLGEGFLRCESREARDIEWTLRRDLWAQEHIGDDRVLWPHAHVSAATHDVQGWGVPLGRKSVGDSCTAWAYDPPFADGIDLSRLTAPDFEYDEQQTRERVERASELVEGRLTVFVRAPDMGHQPFDTAVAMRGMEALLTDCALEPEKVLELMEFLTEADLRHHRKREALGLINCFPSPCGRFQAAGGRYNASWLPEGFGRRAPRLADEWAYVSAQTSAGLGPEMYARLVHPFNCRLASLFCDNTVYYHACEPLDGKYDVLQSLPHLRRLHVSPWSSRRLAHEKFGRSVALEVHAHPGQVFFTHTRQDMADEIGRLLDETGDSPLDLNLSDIHSINGNPETLRVWTETAQEIAASYGPR